MSTYDAADKEVLVVGASHYNETYQVWRGYPSVWSYSQGQWKNLTYQVPSALTITGLSEYNTALTYDAYDGYVLLVKDVGSWLSTWTYAHGVWTNISGSVARPYAGGAYVMAYDVADRAVVLADGLNGWARTFEFHGGNWSVVTSSPTTPGFSAPMELSWDSADQSLVLLNDMGSGSQTFWIFQGGVWTLDSALSTFTSGEYQLVDDPGLSYLMIYGGQYNGPYNRTWLYAGGAWTQFPASIPAPAGAGGNNLVYDPSLSEVISIGGISQNSPPYSPSLPSLWAYGVPQAPLFISSFAATPDKVTPGQATILSVTTKGGQGALSFTYLGLPSGCGSANASSLTCVPTAPGYYHITVFVNDTSGHSASSLLTLLVYVPFTSLIADANPNPAILGQPVNFTSTVSGGVRPLTWAWSFGDGTTGGNLPNITHIYTTNGPFMVTMTVTDSAGTAGHAYVNVTIALTVSLSASASTLSLGDSTIVTMSPRGGDGTYTLTWPGLPTWCTPLSNSTVRCTPTHAGSFAIEAMVTDSSGTSASTSMILVVNPSSRGPPSGTGFLGLPGYDGYYLVIAVSIATLLAIGLVSYRTRRRVPKGGEPEGKADAFREFRQPLGKPEEAPIDTVGEGETDPAEDLF
jgi:PKD repeat protein